MKKRVVKISLAIFVVIGILLGLLVLVALDWGPEVSFRFLDGRGLTARIEPSPGRAFYRQTRYVYSLAADFDDVCAEVDAELSTRGFDRKIRHSMADRHVRDYSLGAYSSPEMLRIRVLDSQKLIEHSTLKSLPDSDPRRYTYASMDGWVSIEISRERLRSWPPRYLLQRLKLMLRRTGKNPPAKK